MNLVSVCTSYLRSGRCPEATSSMLSITPWQQRLSLSAHLKKPVYTSHRLKLSCMGGANSKGSPMAVAKAQKLIGENAVMVFSKTYCPYCVKVKKLISSLTDKSVVYELDVEADGTEIQNALFEITKQRSVPNVFISGKHIGGCDDTVALHAKGGLLPLLQAA